MTARLSLIGKDKRRWLVAVASVTWSLMLLWVSLSPWGCVQLRRPNTCDVVWHYYGGSTKASCMTSTRQWQNNQMKPVCPFCSFGEAFPITFNLGNKNRFSPTNNWLLHNPKAGLGFIIGFYLAANYQLLSRLLHLWVSYIGTAAPPVASQLSQ